jgi:hypothetical protein
MAYLLSTLNPRSVFGSLYRSEIGGAALLTGQVAFAAMPATHGKEGT